MLSIRLQRTGRKKQAQFRVVVQDSRRSPTSGRVIANLGFYNPHTKEHAVDLKKAGVYLQNGAQPSSRVARFLTDQKVDMPSWVKESTKYSKKVKNPDKLRRHRPPEDKSAQEKPKAEVKEEVLAEDDQKSDDSPEDKSAQEETPKEEIKEETSKEEVLAEDDQKSDDSPEDKSTPKAEVKEEPAKEVAPAVDQKSDDSPEDKSAQEEPKAED